MEHARFDEDDHEPDYFPHGTKFSREQLAFFTAFPVLKYLAAKSEHAAESLTEYAYGFEQTPPVASAVEYLPERLQSYPLPQLARALDHPAVKNLDATQFTSIRRALTMLNGPIQEVASAKVLNEAVEALWEGADRLYEYIEQLSAAACGTSHHFLESLMSHSPSLFQGGDLRALKHLMDHIPNQALQIHRPTFSVQSNGTTVCTLGNTKSFGLLQVLAKTPNKFLPFLQIVEAIGEDESDIDALPTAKHRLIRKLRQCGLSQLASHIHSQPGHYGLFWPDTIEVIDK